MDDTVGYGEIMRLTCDYLDIYEGVYIDNEDIMRMDTSGETLSMILNPENYPYDEGMDMSGLEDILKNLGVEHRDMSFTEIMTEFLTAVTGHECMSRHDRKRLKRIMTGIVLTFGHDTGSSYVLEITA